MPLRSPGSLSLNRALMAAGLVDRVQGTLFPVITGQTGASPIFGGAADFDLEQIEHRTLDDDIQELVSRPRARQTDSIAVARSRNSVEATSADWISMHRSRCASSSTRSSARWSST
jgi:hypothetical protein